MAIKYAKTINRKTCAKPMPGLRIMLSNTLSASVTSFQHASAVWSDYRRANDVTGSSAALHAGEILNEHDVVVARVSYNGRIWEV
jgi:hypothetical protein